jgi:hypothetical protein
LITAYSLALTRLHPRRHRPHLHAGYAS